MVQGNERALARAAGVIFTDSRLVSTTGKLSPVTMNSLRKRLQQRVRHVVEECWSRIEVCESSSLQFKTFPKEIVINKIHNLPFGSRRQVEVAEVCKNLLRGLAGWLIHEGLRVRVHLSDIDCLQQLSKG